MMSARQFANNYPGEIVKLAPKHAKGLGLDIRDGEPIGIVVGFKIGKLGQPGSSKVAVWHDKYGMQFGLNPKTETKYNPVIPGAPRFDKGIYFLSVDYLELLTPRKPPKPIVTYPDRCELCNSPCRKGGTLTVCSNDHCKSKGLARKAIGPIPRFYTLDKEGYVLCPTCQINKLDFQEAYGGSNQKHLKCAVGHKFIHPWKDGNKMNHRGTHKYIWNNNSLQHYIEDGKKKKK